MHKKVLYSGHSQGQIQGGSPGGPAPPPFFETNTYAICKLVVRVYCHPYFKFFDKNNTLEYFHHILLCGVQFILLC